MPNSAAKRVIRTYLHQQAPGYALLVDAPWGSGKTYTIKQLTNWEIDPTRLYVTLYDVDSSAAFDWALVRAMKPWSDSPRASWTRRFKELASSVQVFGNSIDLTKVNLTEIALRALPETLIFDDVERCGLGHVQLSGLINRFVEHQHKRVILIANSDQHREKDAFTNSREKLIGQTITLHPEMDAALVAFWTKLPEGQGREILQRRQKLIAKTFDEAGHRNLRLLLRAMRDTAAMLNALTPAMLEFDHVIDRLLSTFLALHMAYQGGQLSKQDMRDRNRYRILLGSGTDKDKVAFDALQAVQAKHPDCEIDPSNNQILPADIGFSLIVDGYASSKEIVDSLNSSHQFSQPSEQPDWIRLWKWAEEPLDELERVITRLKEGFEKLEITEPGEVLQLYGACKFLASQGGIGLNEAGVAGFFRKYIMQLSASEKIPAQLPTNSLEGRIYGYNDENGTCSYGGYAFGIDDIDRKVIDLMQECQDEAFYQKMPEYASDLMIDFSNDESTFLVQFDPLSGGRNYSRIPVFHYVNVQDAVEAFLVTFEKNREAAREVLKLFASRRVGQRVELQEEWGWIDQFEESAILHARKKSLLLGAQVAQNFKWFFKAQ